jgi:hypothetical protein
MASLGGAMIATAAPSEMLATLISALQDIHQEVKNVQFFQKETILRQGLHNRKPLQHD